MHALRSHPFFNSVKWDTLWTDTPPTLAAGLLKKDQSGASAAYERQWNDVGAAWDQLVGNSDDREDDIEWASDAQRPVLGNKLYSNGRDANGKDVAIGPMGETRSVGVEKDMIPSRSADENLPAKSTESRSSSSEENCLVEKLTSELDAFSFRPSSPERRPPSHTSDRERGRTQAMTPVQGNGTPIDL